MLKSVFRSAIWLAILILTIVVYFGIVKPAYNDYKKNKKEVVVDTSGERATSKNKDEQQSLLDITTNIISEDNGIRENSSKDKKKVEETNNVMPLEGVTFRKLDESEVEGASAFTLDDRILLYEGNQNSKFIKYLIDILIEDMDNKLYSKVDVRIENIDDSVNGDIKFENDKDRYSQVLHKLKEVISNDSNYNVKFEYNTIKTIVNKVIITKAEN